MPALSRKGDLTGGGGRIITNAPTVFCNGINVGVHSAAITPHRPGGKHNRAKTTAGSPTVFAEGKPVVRVTSPLSCGHSVIQGSPDTFVP